MSDNFNIDEKNNRSNNTLHFISKLPLTRKYLFILILLVSGKLYSQININGFCNVEKIPVNDGYNSIFTADFNSDYITDILLYNSSKNRIMFIYSNNGKPFNRKKEQFSYFPISDIKYIKTSNQKEKKFFFVSREERLVGLNTINRFLTFKLMTKLKLNSYPTKILVTEKNYIGEPNLFVYGSAYNGISTFEEKNNLLKETRVFSNSLFSILFPFDINYDGFDDIIGFDILKNTIMLFDKTFTDKLLLIRPIKIEKKINHLSATDVNNDDFVDLIYSHTNGFDILMGDSVSSFSSSLTYKTNITPDKFLLEDVNGDGIKDIVFISKDRKSVYISFSISARSFKQPVLLFSDLEFSDLAIISEKSRVKLVVSSSNGNVYIVTKFSIVNKSAKIFFGEPVAAAFFDYKKDGIPALCFVDKVENQLKIISGSKLFNLSELFSFQLSAMPNRIKVDDTDTIYTDFFLFSDSNRVIEFFRLNLKENKQTHKEIIYSHLPINYLEIENFKNNGFNNFKVYSLLKDEESLQSFSFQKNRYVLTDKVVQPVTNLKKYSENNLSDKFKNRRKKYFLEINEKEKCLDLRIK
ncbi:MAG: hypothetical protein JW866_05680 [Ignavibacteriales bacterium]|nr:hypothetical protein [Ignavibacteriales bacterium]